MRLEVEVSEGGALTVQGEYQAIESLFEGLNIFQTSMCGKNKQQPYYSTHNYTPLIAHTKPYILTVHTTESHALKYK